MKIWQRRILGITAVTTAMLLVLLSLIGYTQIGLKASLRLASAVSPGSLHVQGAEGHLLSNFKLDNLYYEDDTVKLRLSNIRLQWRGLMLLTGRVRIRELAADQILFQPKVSENNSDATTSKPLRLPNVDIKELAIQRFVFRQGRDEQWINNIAASLSTNQQQIRIEKANWRWGDYAFTTNGNVDWQHLEQTDLENTISDLSQSNQPVIAKGYIRGHDNKLMLRYDVQKPFSFNANGEISLLAPYQIELSAHWKDAAIPQKPRYRSNGELTALGNWQHYQFALQASTTHPGQPEQALTIKGEGKEQALQVPTIHWQREQAQVNASLQLASDKQWHINVRTEQFNPEFVVKGLNASINLEASADGIGPTAKGVRHLRITQLSGRWLENTLDGNIDWQHASAEDWHFTNSFISIGDNQCHFDGGYQQHWNLSWKCDASQLQQVLPELSGHFNSQGKLQGDKATVHAQSDFNLDELKWRDLTITHYQSTLSLHHQKNTVTMNWHGNGHFQVNDRSQQHEFNDVKTLLTSKLTNKGLVVAAKLQLTDSDTLSADFKLPNYQLFQTKSWQQALKGTIQGKLNHIEWLKAALPNLSEVSGRTVLHADVSGTLADPLVSAKLEATNLQASVPEFGLNLTDGKLLISATDSNRATIAGEMISGKGKIIINGNLSTEDKTVNGQVTLTGSDVTVMNTKSYHLIVNPDLTLKLDRKTMVLTGSIIVNKGRIQAKDFSNSVSLPSEVEFVDEDIEKDESTPLTTDIKITLGDDVKINSHGLKGQLSGELRAQTFADQPNTVATGAISVNKGEYSAYGQNLTLEQAELSYTGGFIDNPGLKIKAYKTVRLQQSSSVDRAFGDAGGDESPNFNSGQQSVRVGVMVSGTANQPKVSLYSSSGGMTQSDMLSYLVLNKPLSNVSKNNSQLLLSAASAMAFSGDSSGGIYHDLQNAFGLDEISFTTLPDDNKTSDGSDFGAENAAVSIGKAVSSKLYVHYTQGLVKGIGIIQLRYLINRRWTLQAESSSESRAADILYTKER